MGCNEAAISVWMVRLQKGPSTPPANPGHVDAVLNKPMTPLGSPPKPVVPLVGTPGRIQAAAAAAAVLRASAECIDTTAVRKSSDSTGKFGLTTAVRKIQEQDAIIRQQQRAQEQLEEQLKQLAQQQQQILTKVQPYELKRKLVILQIKEPVFVVVVSYYTF